MEKIRPIFTQNYVPICFSANDAYVPMLATEIVSIIDHATDKNNYDIVILTTGISDENKVKLYSLIAKHPNFAIRFVDVSPYIYGYNFYLESDITNTKYSSEIYFRVLAPAIMKDYPYVIFLDADLVVLEDIAKLLDYDYSDVMIGAVRDYEGIANCYNNNYERTKYRINELGIKNFNNYFVSGVIVMNIAKFNEEFSYNDLLNLAVSKQWKQYDQDLLNFLCNESVKIVDAEWDFVEDINNIYKSLPKELFEEYEKSEKSPKIIHYSGGRKPWIRTSKYTKPFWQYAEKTPFYTALTAKINND